MTSIYPRLVAPLQVKLAQFALLTHRAAVLAALPTGSKSRTHWATQPAPALLKAVVHYASHPATPKVGQLLLKVWYQKKTELRAAVNRALYEAGYPVPARAAAEPSPWTVRLTPTDIGRQENQLFFCPDGQRVPYAGDASLEESTLMAHLLGWGVHSPPAEEAPPEIPALLLVGDVQRPHLVFRSALEILAKDQLPPDVAAAVARGELPESAAPYWSEHWPVMLNNFRETRAAMQRALHEPVSPMDDLLVFGEFDDLLTRLETRGIALYLSHHHRLNALALLARVDGLRHRQHPDFAPLAALRERTAAVRATYAAEWPLSEETGLATVLPNLQTHALLAQAMVYELLLRLIDEPEELARLDETSEDFQQLEAAVPPGVLNALLLRKLESPDC